MESMEVGRKSYRSHKQILDIAVKSCLLLYLRLQLTLSRIFCQEKQLAIILILFNKCFTISRQNLDWLSLHYYHPTCYIQNFGISFWISDCLSKSHDGRTEQELLSSSTKISGNANSNNKARTSLI